jgi:hypothetical protein
MGEAARDNVSLIPDESWHYPPDLLNLLVDTIPLLCKSKLDVVTFFRGAGVPSSMLAEWEERLRVDRQSARKHAIARSILCALNDRGDAMIRPRREVIRRVVEFEDFSGCWENDQLRARGCVAAIRDVVNVKDSFTRMNQERERERKARQAAREAQIMEVQARRNERQEIQKDLFSLFAEQDRAKRGKALESVLNRLFRSYGLLVKEAFTVCGAEGEGIVEQIDGAVDLDGHLCLVEMKWRGEPLGKGDVAQHLVRVYGRAEARGILISASPYTDAAVATCREALHQKVAILVELREIVAVLERDGDVRDLLRRKVQAAIMERNPLARFSI